MLYLSSMCDQDSEHDLHQRSDAPVLYKHTHTHTHTLEVDKTWSGREESIDTEMLMVHDLL